ncbi:MAG: hypothetical protein WA691_05890 [Thermoplasmata archaeon]
MEASAADARSIYPNVEDAEGIRRARVIGYTGAGVSFLFSQIGLLWVLATGGVGSNPSAASVIWLIATLATALFLLQISDSYRRHPRWLTASKGSS